MTSELCPHGRLTTAYCEPCLIDKWECEGGTITVAQHATPTGLDAKYYDLPNKIHCIQDLIEWLDLSFANGNILKSLIREYNPDGGKDTDEIYEAEKRFYFAKRHLEEMRRLFPNGSGGD